MNAVVGIRVETAMNAAAHAAIVPVRFVRMGGRGRCCFPAFPPTAASSPRSKSRVTGRFSLMGVPGR